MFASIVRHRLFSRGIRLCALLFAASLAGGCMPYFIAAAYLIGGPPMVEPEFDKQTNKSMTAKDTTVAVVCFAPDDVRYQFDNINHDIAKYVTHQLHAKQVKVFTPEVVRDWLDKHDDWDKPEEIGAALNATYVIFIDLHKFTLWAEHSPNLRQGRSECLVSVVEMSPDGTGERIFSKEIISKYPLAVPRPASETTYDTFRRQYLSRFSDEIGRLFYEYENGRDIGDAT